LTQIVLTSGSNWIVPADCTLIDKVECVGAGAPGAVGAVNSGPSGGFGGAGGGSGAYARKNSVPVTPGGSIPTAIGTNSNATSFGAFCVAAGASGQSAGASGVGDSVLGGNPGTTITTPIIGSNGNNGGNGGPAPGPYGGAGGVGGAGGAGFNNGSPGNPGGPYGGGGGGGGGAGGFGTNAAGAGGAPGQGVIVINYTPQPPPTVGSCAPNTGPATGGTPVTITGTNFASISGVTFGGVAATNVVVVNATTITCVAPPHPAGAVSVVVTGTAGSASGSFTYQASSGGFNMPMLGI